MTVLTPYTDCVSFKPNSTEILVQNMHCNGSHGISVGSLGQYPGEVDIVKNVHVYNISMYNASVCSLLPLLTFCPSLMNEQDMARIKVWPGSSAAMSQDLQGGGGLGSVSNITYNHMYIDNVDWAIEVTQCYGQDNMTLCNEFPVCFPFCPKRFSFAHMNRKAGPELTLCMQSNLTISDIHITDMYGMTSGAYDPDVGTIVCSSPDVCLLFLDFLFPLRFRFLSLMICFDLLC